MNATDRVTGEALAEMILGMEPGESIRVRLIDGGKRFSIAMRRDRFGLAKFFGIIPDGRRRVPASDYRMLHEVQICGWADALELVEG